MAASGCPHHAGLILTWILFSGLRKDYNQKRTNTSRDAALISDTFLVGIQICLWLYHGDNKTRDEISFDVALSN